jgi:hypothetical protein
MKRGICLAVKCNWPYNKFRPIRIQEFKIDGIEAELGKSHGKELCKSGLRYKRKYFVVV